MRPTPTQMLDGIQFQLAFGDTTITSCATTETAPQMQRGGMAGDAGTEDYDASHPTVSLWPPAGPLTSDLEAVGPPETIAPAWPDLITNRATSDNT